MNRQVKIFEEEKARRIASLGQDEAFSELSMKWLEESMRKGYVYNFNWLGRPIIQNPIDIMAMQEIIWTVQPDLIIETGIAHGGSLIFSASMLELISACGGNDGQVIGIDIDIREHNKEAILAHPMSKRIKMIQGSSVDSVIVEQVKSIAAGKQKVLICLDSNHTESHVLQELDAYARLATVGSYCVVFDTFVEDMPENFFPDRPWDRGNNPKTAVKKWLHGHSEFVVDHCLQDKLMITVAPDGFLKRIR